MNAKLPNLARETVPRKRPCQPPGAAALGVRPLKSVWKGIAMIIGAHSIIYSTNAEPDRAFFRDVLKLPHVDVGDGWLIFGLPPAELAVHPSEADDGHELFLMCDDLDGFIAELNQRNIACAPVQERSYGLVTELTLPSGGKLGFYQPRHPRPKPMRVGKAK
jgi:hypothetical protein